MDFPTVKLHIVPRDTKYESLGLRVQLFGGAIVRERDPAYEVGSNV